MDLTRIMELQKKRMSIGNNSAMDDMDSTLFRDFESNPAYRLVEFDGEKVGIHFIDNGIARDMPSRYSISKPPFQFNVGDIVDVGEGERWLCTAINSLQYNKAFFVPCNLNLKFVNKKDELITNWCRATAQTLYTTGVKDEKTIRIPDGMQGVQLPYNEGTKDIQRNDGFVFNGAKYRVTFYDKVTFPGLLNLVCQEEFIGDNDDRINEIADRWVNAPGGGKRDRLPWLDDQEPIAPTEPELEHPTGVSYSISIETPYHNDDKEVLSLGETYRYKIHKFIDGIEVDGSFSYELSDSSSAKITLQDDDFCEITARTDIFGHLITEFTVIDVDSGIQAINKIIKIRGR